MAEVSKVDLVAQLPDEVLMEIFGHLPSLRDKLRLESVNTRFQRCLLELLRTRPIPFVYTDTPEEQLNGYCLKIPVADALESLGKKVKFSSIDINVHRAAADSKELDSVLTALVSSDIDCLDKVTTFKVRSDCRCGETLLRDLFAKCTKLSEVRLLDFPFAPNLGIVLKDKALTQLSAYLSNSTQEQVIRMFQSIKPNTLKKINLRLSRNALNMDILVTELRGGGWSALEQIDIQIVHNLSIDTLFSSLNRLPALRKCKFVLVETRQLVPALTSLAAGLRSLFADRAEITVKYQMYCHNPTGCQFVALIRQVQSEHPGLEVGFGPDGSILTLTLGKVSFKQCMYPAAPCDNTDCPGCRIFYPTVLFRIESEAGRLAHGGQPEVHLANARLDRCIVDSVADHLNARGWRWKVLEAQMNETRGMATITFQSRYGRFQITIDCGQCLSNGCFACLYVG